MQLFHRLHDGIETGEGKRSALERTFICANGHTLWCVCVRVTEINEFN